MFAKSFPTFILLLPLFDYSGCQQAQPIRDNIKRLTENLFGNNKVDVNIPPMANHNDTVNVQIGMSLLHILELNEMEGSFLANVWIIFEWGDSRLQWNRSDYGGVDALKLPPSMIWKPDVTLYNSATAKEMFPFGIANIVLYDNGHIWWINPATIHSTCNLDHRNYPFDEQTCLMKFGSWVHDGYIISLQIGSSSSPALDVSDLVENPVWQVTGTSANVNVKYYSCCEVPYPDVTFTVQLRRRSPYFKSLLVTPAVLAIVLTLTIFWIPSSSTSRIFIGVFNSLTLLILSLYLGWRVPMGGKEVPIIFIFSNSLFVLCTLTIPITALVRHIESRSRQIPVPRCLDFLIKGPFSLVLFTGSASYRVEADRGVKLLDVDTESENHVTDRREEFPSEWKMAAAVIDYIIFSIYCVIIFVILLLYLV